MPRNPILEWRGSFGYMAIFNPSEVLGAANGALGALQQQLSEAETQERSLAGRVATVFGFPAEVRRIAGGTSKATGQLAFWGTIAIPLLVTVLGGLILAKVFGVGV
jgi:hypothetical protein